MKTCKTKLCICIALVCMILSACSTSVKEKLRNAEKGDYVTFGKYEQDNDTSNGKEDIEWLVLEKTDDRALIISKYILDCKPFNTEYIDVTWEMSTLREWLNNDFLNDSFSNEEKAIIPAVTVTTSWNETQDKVFLLGIFEENYNVGEYFRHEPDRMCKPTEYAIANGVDVNKYNGNCSWWLRSPGVSYQYADTVDGNGIIYYGTIVMDVNYEHNGVRPVMWIDLNE